MQSRITAEISAPLTVNILTRSSFSCNKKKRCREVSATEKTNLWIDKVLAYYLKSETVSPNRCFSWKKKTPAATKINTNQCETNLSIPNLLSFYIWAEAQLLVCGSVDAVVAVSEKAVVLLAALGVCYVLLDPPLHQHQFLPCMKVWTVARRLSLLTLHFPHRWKTDVGVSLLICVSTSTIRQQEVADKQ